LENVLVSQENIISKIKIKQRINENCAYENPILKPRTLQVEEEEC